MASDEILKRLEIEYKIWYSKQKFTKVDSVYTKDVITKELSLFKEMFVEEYTLYMKWEHLNGIYPNKNNLFFKQPLLDQYVEAKIAKQNIWQPNHIDDYLNLEPELVLCDTSKTHKEWIVLRHFISTMPFKGVVGRRLNYIVRDKSTKKTLGIFCLASDFLDLTPRDKHIGWEREAKTQRMINHTGIGATIIPTQPVGFNYLGGKLLALLLVSKEVEQDWNKKYKEVLAGITTTSLYGSFSQYNSLKYWKKMGKTTGKMRFNHTSKVFSAIKEWLLYNEPRFYFETFIFKLATGPYRRNNVQASTIKIYKCLDIKENAKSDQKRGIYWCPLYENTNDFLCERESELKNRKFDGSVDSLVELWKEKYVKKRVTNLIKSGRINNDMLFYDDMLENDWKTIKEKYLKSVGR